MCRALCPCTVSVPSTMAVACTMPVPCIEYVPRTVAVPPTVAVLSTMSVHHACAVHRDRALPRVLDQKHVKIVMSITVTETSCTITVTQPFTVVKRPVQIIDTVPRSQGLWLKVQMITVEVTPRPVAVYAPVAVGPSTVHISVVETLGPVNRPCTVIQSVIKIMAQSVTTMHFTVPVQKPTATG